MKLLEKFRLSKTGKLDDCEDAYFCTDHFAGVIDGATNVSGRLFDGKTPGQLAAATIQAAILELHGTEDIAEILAAINRRYESMYAELGIIDLAETTPYMRPSASMIIYSKHWSKIWMIGDCQCFFDGQLHQNIKRVDEVFEEVRSIVIKGELLRGRTEESLLADDIGFELIRPLIQKQYNFQNATPDCSLSYAVINGFHIPEELIKTVEVPAETTEICFGSDGYTRLFETLEKTEDELVRLLEIDPLCIEENIGTKGVDKGNVSFDDRTFIRVRCKGNDGILLS